VNAIVKKVAIAAVLVVGVLACPTQRSFGQQVWLENKNPTNDPLSAANLSAFGFQVCGGKRYCGLIYVAPWCPACKKMSPLYREFLANADRSPDYGIQLVVGAGRTPQQNDEAVASYGKGAVADQSRRVGNYLGIHSFPSYFVLDSNRTVISSGSAALAWMASKFH
jgi:thiol-disulfide isomerase/thioredoxin